MTSYRGRIFKGIGIAKERVEQNSAVYQQAIGVELVPGTLNVRLGRDFSIPEGSIRIPAEKIRPIGSTRDVLLVLAKLHGNDVVIMCPDPPFYDKKVIEIMAPFNISEHYGLAEGDEIEVVV